MPAYRGGHGGGGKGYRPIEEWGFQMSENLAAGYADDLRESCERFARKMDKPNMSERKRERLYEELSEWPLEIVSEVGQPFAVLVTYGGPNAWLFRDRFEGDRLEVHWGGQSAVRRGDAISRVLDYYAEYAGDFQ